MIISKWVTDSNVECKTIKLLGDNVGENLNDPGFGNDILDKTPKIQSVKERIDKLVFIKIKDFCSVEDTVKGKKEKPQTRKNRYFTYFIKNMAKDYYPKYAKNF